MSATYPVHVNATLDRRLSRWLWLVKWFLAIPHLVVLFFLWIAFVGVSVAAFFAILFTGRYPRGMFDFNVGVLRWTWRVSYYTYDALGTDRYPPFTLDDVPDYPAHLDIDYPEHLSRGLVLVKWWLLAIPHYLVVGVFFGSGGSAGLVGVLVLIAAVALAVTGRYPEQIYDFVLGMNRWALRVAAYAGLMTDEYPPFRLDMGGSEPTGAMTMGTNRAAVETPIPPATSDPTVDPPAAPPAGYAGFTAPPSVPPAMPPAMPPAVPPTVPPAVPPTGYAAPAAPSRRGWTPWRITSLVLGSILGMAAFGLLAGGGVATWATNTQRDSAGYLTTGTHTFATASYAITTDRLDLGGVGDAVTPGDVLGTVRIRVSSIDPTQAVFVGVGTEQQVDTYLAGVDHLVLTSWSDTHARTVIGPHTGAPPTTPGAAHIWAAQAVGRGTQTLTWQPSGGHWVVVVMNANAAPHVAITGDAGATVPDLGWYAAGLLIGGVVLLGAAVVLIVVPVVRASRADTPGRR